MKKTYFLIILAIATCLIQGCDKEIAPINKITIGLSTPNVADAYNKVVYDAALSKSLSLNTTLVQTNAEGKIQSQRNQLQSMRMLKFDITVISPFDIDSIKEQISLCKQMNIPVVLINNRWYQGVDAAVFADYEDAAKKSSDYLAQLKPNGATYSILYTDGLSKSNREYLTTGIVSNLSDPKYTASLSNGSARYCASAAAARTTARTLINRASPNNVTAFITYDDVTAQGTREAIVELGKEDEVVVISISGSPTAKSMIKNGEIQGSIFISPLQLGELAIEVANNIVNGLSTEKEIKVPAILINKDNIDSFDLNSWK